ncbi:hypothetical protein AYJ54_00575 [Bradyrhizobium centrolobii]|uniref:ERF family protein n=1 Tax=Bradyrhizobium centrolobii TaxID=1505087 RepID=A0A176YFL8_9BRAD|nr:ERF family protein [Bradyrhizobium centrolobii]OAF05433.1 hypothetical protein AYJ54_00575 [Bradyrhizobium centrolobii]
MTAALPIENVRQIEGPTSRLPVQSENAAVLGMIERVARDTSVDMSKMVTLMQWHKDTIADQKRAAFDEAMAGAKAEIPVISKNREVDFTSSKGRTHYKYEDLAEIARVVSPILARHGLSYRYRVASNVNEPVTVTCIVSHRGGHFEEVTLLGGRDESGNKNSIQAVASTLTYLQRMTLKAALGLAASDDDDGKEAESTGTISLEQVEQLLALADEVEADKEAFCRYFKVDGIAQLKAKDFDRAIAALNKRRSAK